MTRLPPNAVCHQHHPGRLGLHFADLHRALAAGHRAQRCQRGVRRLRRDEGDELALVGDVHRVDAEDLRGARDRRLHRDVALAHDHRHAGGARQLVEHRGDAAARRVAHAAQAAARPRPAARRPPATASRCPTRTSASRSNSPRASMIAVPWSPIVPETMIRSPGRRLAGDSGARASTRADAGRAEVHLVGVAALDDLGVAGDDLDAGRLRGRGDRLDLGAQLVGRQALLEHQREAQRQRPRAGHGEVVDRAVDGELADRAAGEADRLDHEAVGGERQRRRRRS